MPGRHWRKPGLPGNACVLEVSDDRRACSQLHFDHVETKGVRGAGMQAEIGADRPAQRLSFPPADRKVSGHKAAVSSRLDLDKNGRTGVPRDQVDFLAPVVRIVPVAGENGEASLTPQEFCGKRLAARPPFCGGFGCWNLRAAASSGRVAPHGDLTDLALQAFVLLRILGHTSIMATFHTAAPLAHKLAVLVFLENKAGEHLLMLRAKQPNLGVWSPIGGKVETGAGESPFECAVRETFEETGHAVTAADLHLFATIAEKAYEGQAHWLMFLFRCRRPIAALPKDIHEGKFGFFSRAAVSNLPIPETDRAALWPIYDSHRDQFVSLKADCSPGKPVRVEIEEIMPAQGAGRRGGSRRDGRPAGRLRP